MINSQHSIEKTKEMVEYLASALVTTGTGKGSFDEFDAEYQHTYRILAGQLKDMGLKPTFPWRSLWEWHGYYNQELPTYASRRLYVGSLKNDALNQLENQSNGQVVHDPAGGESEATWENIDSRITGVINEYTTARDKDSWQDVGRRSREVLIDLSKLIADPKLVPDGVEQPKAADARAWFDRLLDHHAGGRDRAELRALMRKTWDLSQKVTHGDIDAVDAFAAAQATVLLVRTTQMLLTKSAEDAERV